MERNTGLYDILAYLHGGPRSPKLWSSGEPQSDLHVYKIERVCACGRWQCKAGLGLTNGGLGRDLAHLREVGAGEALRLLREEGDGHVRRDRALLQVGLQDGLARRGVHMDGRIGAHS